MRFIKKTIVFLIMLLILAIMFLIGLGYSMYKSETNDMDLATKINSIRIDEDYVLFEDLPDEYVTAVIAAEDHRFYSHKGIDIISLGRAVINNIKAMDFVEGGSTITQQVAKNMYFTQEKSLIRKIAEVFVAYDLEKNYEKEEILELYVNISYFGDGYYGIGQATKGYLGKKPKDMTLLESTLLAGIPNAPSVYAPTKNPDLAKERQKQVIDKMLKLGDLTQEEANSLYKSLE